MKFAKDHEAFLRDQVNLNQDRINRLQKRVNTIDNFLASSGLADAYHDLIPAGSWAQGTIIRPVDTNDTFDADVLLLLDEQDDWAAKDYLDEVFALFRASGTYKGLVGRAPKTRCVRINYADEFHIDVVPYLERHGLMYITNREEPPETGSYELSNPEAITEWVDERQRITNGHFIKVVRQLKYLRDFKNTFSCKSIILTTILGERVNAIQSLVDPGAYTDLPSTLHTIMRAVADNLPEEMPPVMDPGGTGDNFVDRYRDEWNYSNFRDCMIMYANKIEAAYLEGDRDKSIALWRDIFGNNFKSGTVAKKSVEASLASSEPCLSEQFIDQAPYGFPIRLDPGAELRIEGRVTGFHVGQVTRRNGFRQFTLSKHGNRVPKNRTLRFTARTNLRTPYDLYWKVRNGGHEAADANQLRGEIRKDQGAGVRTEPTAYAGYHYVECYAVTGGAVVAIDRQRVIVT